MSNHLAIAAVTATLRHVLELGLQQHPPDVVGGSKVHTVRPDRLATLTEPGVNLFLYNVSPNHGWNLTDLPTRRGDGSFLRRPVVALDLHYLLTCHGTDESLQAHQLLGRVVITLDVNAILTRDLVSQAIAVYSHYPELAFLAQADLADQVELVKVSPVPLSLEELSKLWSVFFQTPYELSLAYTATVVIIEADVSLWTALPVRKRRVILSTGPFPRLITLNAEPGEAEALTGSTVVLEGAGLLSARTVVRVGTATFDPEPATAVRLEFKLDERVPAGLHGVQVRHLAPLTERSDPLPDTSPTERVLAESNVLPLVVRPTVSVQHVDADEVTLTISPPLYPGQRASVQLSRLPGSPAPPAGQPHTRTFWQQSIPTGSPPQATIVLARRDVPDGEWLIRVQVDGVDSVLDLVGDLYAHPALTLTPP